MTLDWTCIIQDCSEQIRKREYCEKHYAKLKNSGELGGNICKIDDCNNGVSGRGYCHKHYYRAKANGEFNLDKCEVTTCEKYKHGKVYCQMHYNIGRTYGINPSIYDEMISEQRGLCAICNIKPLKLVVDHDHETGKVRGLLCNNCNRGIGFLKDNANILESAALYIANIKALLHG